MVLTRKDFRLMARETAKVDDFKVRRGLTRVEIRISSLSNPRFSKERFISFINKRRRESGKAVKRIAKKKRKKR